MPTRFEDSSPVMLGAREEKKALVLAGGGITGFLYEVGILTAYDEWSGAPCSANNFDIYVGTSAGALLDRKSTRLNSSHRL